jgi:hypothetical protein
MEIGKVENMRKIDNLNVESFIPLIAPKELQRERAPTVIQIHSAYFISKSVWESLPLYEFYIFIAN